MLFYYAEKKNSLRQTVPVSRVLFLLQLGYVRQLLTRITMTEKRFKRQSWRESAFCFLSF